MTPGVGSPVAMRSKEPTPVFAGMARSKIQITIDSLRPLSEHTAIEDGRAIVDPPPVGTPGISKYAVVHVKVDGKWLMASVRDAWVEAPTAVWTAADLEWLVGNWVAEEYGVKTESTCRGWWADAFWNAAIRQPKSTGRRHRACS